MKWPFVSRTRYDALQAELTAQNIAHAKQVVEFADTIQTMQQLMVDIVKRAGDEAERGDKRYADLMTSYRMLRLHGAVEQTPALTAKPAVELDPLVAAINRKAGGNAQIRSLMLRQLAQDRADGKKDGEILLQIDGGVSPQNGSPL